MFWKKSGRGSAEQGPEEAGGASPGPIQIERDAERPETILRVAGELERRGAEVVELFKDLDTPKGRAVLPIHLHWQKQNFFIEIETRAWKNANIEKALDTAAALRGSKYADAGLGLLSAYPVPEEVNFFFGRSTAALLQLDLYGGRQENPEGRAALLTGSVRRRLNANLYYDLESLARTEKLLNQALQADESDQATGDSIPILSSLAECLGCYVGEVIRRSARLDGEWTEPVDGNPETLLEMGEFTLDPIGNSRAFLKNGSEDSVAYYAKYVLQQLEDPGPD